MFVPRLLIKALTLLPSSLVARFPQGYPSSTWGAAPPATTQWGNDGGRGHYTPPAQGPPPVSTWAPAPAPAPPTTLAPSPTTWAAPAPTTWGPPAATTWAAPGGQQPGGLGDYPGVPAPPGAVVGGPVTIIYPDKTVVIENPQVTVAPHGDAADWAQVPDGWYAQTYYSCVPRGCEWHEVMHPYAWAAGGRTEPWMVGVGAAAAAVAGIVWIGI